MICQFLNAYHMLCFPQTDILNRYRYIDVSLSTEHAGGNHGPINRFIRVTFYGRTDPGNLHWGAALSAGGGGLRGEEAGVPRAAGADLRGILREARRGHRDQRRDRSLRSGRSKRRWGLRRFNGYGYLYPW